MGNLYLLPSLLYTLDRLGVFPRISFRALAANCCMQGKWIRCYTSYEENTSFNFYGDDWVSTTSGVK